jgi:hypothetical protein
MTKSGFLRISLAHQMILAVPKSLIVMRAFALQPRALRWFTPTFVRFVRGGALIVLALSMPGKLSAEPGTQDVTQLAPFRVEGRAMDLIGVALTSSQGTVGSAELDVRPFLRRGELLEVIPGVVITQHSGGGKANQYFLRGFNLDHGTDFSVSVEGMPVNMRAHAHGQGYADVNFMIPEFVEGVDYVKGPFFTGVGDFSSAGAAGYRMFRELPEDFVRVEFGEDRFQRFVTGTTLRRGTSSTLLGIEAEHYDGPWLLEDDFRRFNFLGRHTWRRKSGEFTLTAMGYGAQWDATDQIPLRAIEDGRIDRFGFVDPSNGGDSDRFSLSFDWAKADAQGSTRLNAYAIRYSLNLFSNFTYFLDDPEAGDQFNQRDRRTLIGGALARTWLGNPDSLVERVVAGVQTQTDWVDELSLSRTSNRELVSTVRSDEVLTSSVGLHADVKLRLSEKVHADAGIRADLYAFDVESDNASNSGQKTSGIVSPKVSVVYRPADKLEFYLSGGHGFHSNDARGVVIQVDPASGDPVSRASPLASSRGFELGIRTSPLEGWVSTASWWVLDSESELVFVGDAGGTEATGASRRQGVEFTNFYRVGTWLALDADLTLSRARYKDSPGNDRIANSISRVVTGGATFNLPKGWTTSVRVRHFGSQPLVEDNSVRSPSSLTLNAEAGFNLGGWRVECAVLNLLDRDNADIAYFYTSRLPGEPAEGIDDIHLHPAEPRTVRVSLTRSF